MRGVELLGISQSFNDRLEIDVPFKLIGQITGTSPMPKASHIEGCATATRHNAYCLSSSEELEGLGNCRNGVVLAVAGCSAWK